MRQFRYAVRHGDTNGTEAGFYSFHRRKTLNHLVRTYLINYRMILLAEGGQFYKTP